jgi:hypothetical protein
MRLQPGIVSPIRLWLLCTMRRVIWFTLAAALFAGSSSLSRAELDWAQKEISLAPSLGTTVIEAGFTFTNRGERPVRVWVAGASCGCVTPALEKDIYAPGESGTIRASYKPGAQSGHQEKTIRVATDEPNAKETVLVLKVDLPELYKISPRVLRWKVGEDVQPKSATITLPPGAGWAAPELEVPVGFQAAIEPAGDGQRYTFRLTPEATAESHRGTLVVQLTGASVEPVRVPVLLIVQ